MKMYQCLQQNLTKILTFVLLLGNAILLFSQTPISKDSILKLLPNNIDFSKERNNFDSSKYANFSKLIVNFNAIEDKKLKADVAYSIAQYYMITADISSSRQYFGYALDLYEELEDWKQYVNTTKELSTAYFYRPDFTLIDSILKRALEVSEKHDVGHYVLNPIQELTVFNSYFKLDYKEAIKYGTRFFEELAIYGDLEGDNDLLISKITDARIVDLELGHSYVELGQLGRAEFHLNRAKTYFVNNSNNEKLFRINTHLSKLAIDRGEFDKLLPLHQEISSNFKKDQQGIQSNFTQAHSQVVKRMALEQQIKDKAIRIAKLSKDRQVLGFLIGIIIICSLIGLWWALKAKKLNKELNIVLQTQVDSSNQLNKEKSKYFAILSHELRTPIFAITGLTELLRKGEKLDAENINAIISSGEFLLQLVNNILQLNKIEDKNKIVINEVEFNLMSVLESTQQSQQYYADQKKISLVFMTNLDGKEIVTADKQKIEQVLANLLSNAIKYAKEGGKVLFIVNRTKISDVQNDYHFEIIDDGVGIKQDELQSILNFSNDKFDTLVHNDKLKTKGVGIGLYIVSCFLEALNTELEIGSTPDKGTSFYFDISLKNAVEVKRNMDDLKLGYNTINVLVVDDNKLNLMITKKLLNDENINCTTASDEDPLISLINQNNIDIAMVDLSMPTVDGYEWVSRIRQAGITIPILAHTAAASEDVDSEHLRTCGFQGLVVKPYTSSDIKEKLLITLLVAGRILPNKMAN